MTVLREHGAALDVRSAIIIITNLRVDVMCESRVLPNIQSFDEEVTNTDKLYLICVVLVRFRHIVILGRANEWRDI